MASFMFGVNPFSTPVGQRIDRATDGSLASEDWALNIEICDIINETDEGPKDATRALRKRLQGNKNWKAVLLTLTVLETCVKNCGRRFHVCIASKEFMTEMTKLLSPKNNPPQIVQEKILSLIQSWSDAFRGHPDLIVVVQTYESMKAQGIEFPAQDLDTLSPIYTPERSVPFQPKANNQLVSRPETDAAPRQSEPNSPVTQPLAPSYPLLYKGTSHL